MEAICSSFREDYVELEIELGHVPAYDEEQESEIGILKTKDNGM
jgi:hypothetical protein